MLKTLRAGHATGFIRDDIDLSMLATTLDRATDLVAEAGLL